MQFKTMKPSRRALLSLAVVATLAPAGVGLHEILTPEAERTAATIADLFNAYDGALWSNRDTDIQGVSIALQVTDKVRTRFTGNFSINDGKGAQTIPVTGGVSNSGRVAFNGAVNQPNLRVRVTATGQLSANGSAILGTYNVSGRGFEGPINDRGTFILTLD